jgi:hypothetical protein
MTAIRDEAERLGSQLLGLTTVRNPGDALPAIGRVLG